MQSHNYTCTGRNMKKASLIINQDLSKSNVEKQGQVVKLHGVMQSNMCICFQWKLSLFVKILGEREGRTFQF